jgi:hypothetical protein
MGLDFLIPTFDILGKVLVSLTVLKVHNRLVREHKVDDVVERAVHSERVMVSIGIMFMVISYGAKLYLTYGMNH